MATLVRFQDVAARQLCVAKSPNQALLTPGLHADYMGGGGACRMQITASDNAVGHTQNLGLQRLCSKHGGCRNMPQCDCMHQIAPFPPSSGRSGTSLILFSSGSSGRQSTRTAFRAFRPHQLDRAFLMTYFEKHYFGHLLINSDLIQAFHISF